MSVDPGSAPFDDARWLARAGRLLAGLGFELVTADSINGDGRGHLLVALRAEPTLRHFDAESIDYWITDGARGRASRLDRETRLPVASAFAWGRIALTDRLGVKNEFLSFGGELRAGAVADGTTLVDFSSDAPILRWSGHSQTADPLAAGVGAFFARIRIPIDFVPGAEALVSRAAPRVLYCAFIQYSRERLAGARTLSEANRRLADWTARESGRMETSASDDWMAAAELRRQLGESDPNGHR
ncbi:MAG: hypothetical protein ABSG37_08975 [Candidatus Limnocylindrales bacterium]|jgi:hypothetical protein